MTKLMALFALLIGLIGCGKPPASDNTRFKGVWRMSSSFTSLEIDETTVTINQSGQVTKYSYTVVSYDHATINAMIMPDGSLADRGPYKDMHVGTNGKLMLIYENTGYEFLWVKGL